MEIAYGFSRFGRYAYDIAEVLDMFGDASKLDATTDKEIQVMSAKVLEMIDVGVKAFLNKDVEKEAVLERMDDEVDDMYVAHIKRVLKNPEKNAAANISATLIMRYLERIADHANYLGETVNYIVKGERKPRK
jgi:phosphate transport system protein